jgi:hypothetical protein
MPARALAEALPDFAVTARQHPPADPDPFPTFKPAARTSADPPVPEGPSVDERIAAAEETLRVHLAGEHAEAVAAIQAEHEAEMAALEAKLGEELGTLVARVFAETEHRLVELTGSAAARILGIALGEDLEKRAVDALARTIRVAMADSEGLRIVVRGAPHLQETLRAALGDKAEHLEFHDNGVLDLSVEIDDKVFETRLSEWSSALAGVLA